MRGRLGLPVAPLVASKIDQVRAHPDKLSIGTLSGGHLLFIDDVARTMHTHICGGTGKGKSTLLEHMIRQDIRNGAGVCVIDPHGGHQDNLYNNILRWLDESNYHEERTVHLIDPSDKSHVLGFNPLQRIKDVDLSVITDAALEAMEVAWDGENTTDKPRLRRIITGTFALLAEFNLSLAEADWLFDTTDGRPLREFLGRTVENRFARSVWKNLLHKEDLDASKFDDYIEAPINRFAEFTRSDTIHRIFGQTEGVIDFRKAMDEQDVILVNLQGGDSASGKASKLLGTLIVRDLFEQCKRRNNPDKPFYLYIDECHNYLSGDIPAILDEARKFGLHAILAHQRLGQLEEAGEYIYSAVRGSTEIKVVMGGLAMDEAKVMAEDIIPLDLETPVASLISPTVVGYKTIELHNSSVSKGEGRSESFTDSDGTTESSGFVFGTSTSKSSGDSSATSIRPDATNPEAAQVDTAGEFSGEGEGTSEAYFEALAETRTTSHTIGTQSSTTESSGLSEAREAILEERATSVFGLDKLLYMAASGLSNLKIGEAVVSIGDVALKIETQHVKQRPMQRSLEEFKRALNEKSSFAIPVERAEGNIAERHAFLQNAIEKYTRTFDDDFSAWDGDD